jgi:nitrogen fixation protein FixH
MFMSNKASSAALPTSGRPLTGRTVLICFLAFFGVVFAANIVFVRLAVSTFGGVETESSYKAGLAFGRDTQAARAQEARHWQVDASVTQDGAGTRIIVTARDAQGEALPTLEATVQLAHPTSRRDDAPVTMSQTGPGRFEGHTTAQSGQRDLVIELRRGGERVFRSKSRITL